MNKFEISHVVTFVVAMVLLSASNIASATAGKVIYGYGDNYALDRDGNRRDMRKGSKINEGDTLITGRGRMHVRLRDGGYVSVYPNSEYKIETFVYEGNAEAADTAADDKPANKEQGIFSLLKGAARQVTGLLGRYNRENFKFKTPVATIGIRGTGFFAKLCQSDCFDADGNLIPDGLYVKNNTGVITMTTDAGDIALAQGQSAFAASKSDSPQQILQPPVVYNVVNPDIEQYDFDEKVVDTSLTGNTGGPIEPLPPTPPGLVLSHLEFVSATSKSTADQLNGFDVPGPNSSVVQNGDAIEHFETEVFAGSLVPVVFDKGTATLAESGTDSSLGVIWNRWSGAYVHTQNGVPVVALDNNIHLIGAADMTQNLPSNGIMQYDSTGGTSPTFSGATGNQVGTQTVSATIDYFSNEVFNLDIVATFSDATVTAMLQNTSGNIVSPGGTVFPMTAGCSGGGCGANGLSLTGNASVNVVGPNAEGIFGLYNLTSGTGENAVSGSYVAPGTVVLP